MAKALTIAIDFDGTCIPHTFPYRGEDIGSVPILKRLAAKHKLILWTTREGFGLEDAQKWLTERGIPFSLPEGSKPKADLFIDDLALGVPLTVIPSSQKPHVDWKAAEEWLVDAGII